MDIIFGSLQYDNMTGHMSQFEHFCKSLRLVNTQCDCVIVCHEKLISKTFSDICKKYNVILHKYHDDNIGNIVFKRFKIYGDYLKTHNVDDFNKILITDVNDVLFLKDPFSFSFESNLYLASLKMFNSKSRDTEYFQKHLKNYPFDLSKFLEKNKTKFICCAGTILGEAVAISNFINFYICEQSKYNYEINDQCLFNIYLYEHCKDTFEAPDVSKSFILTLSETRMHYSNKNPPLKNELGNFYSILHWPGSSSFSSEAKKFLHNIRLDLDNSPALQIQTSSWIYFLTKDYKFWDIYLKRVINNNIHTEAIYIDDLNLHNSYHPHKWHHFLGNSKKIELVIEMIKKNINNRIIFSDCTLCLHPHKIKECLTYLQKLTAKDIYFPANDNKLDNVNIGFMLIQCNSKTLNFFENCLKHHKCQANAWDQQIINNCLKKYEIDYDILDTELFVCSDSLTHTQKEKFFVFKQFQNIKSNNKKTDSNNKRLKFLHENTFITTEEFEKYKFL